MKMSKEKFHTKMVRRYRALEGSDFEMVSVRNDEEKTTYKIKGTPIVYNREVVLYENQHFRLSEIIETGAAREALVRAEQVLLWNHESSKPMAARKNNTLSVREDVNGVYIEADVSGTVWGRDGFEAINSGLVDKMSFGFYVNEDGYTEERFVESGKRCCKRSIKKLERVVDFSPVTYPAYQDTDVQARDVENIQTDFDTDEAEKDKQREKLRAQIDELKKLVEKHDK